MEKYDSTGKWIATQVESAILNTVARVKQIKVKRSRGNRKRRIPVRVVKATWDEIRARAEIKPEYAGDWAGGEFNHAAHLENEAAKYGLVIK